MSQMDFVMNLIRDEYAKLDDVKQVCISPAKLADLVVARLDPKKRSPVDMHFLAILELRQLARGVCAKQHCEAEETVEQQTADLFEYRLQTRYPARRDDDDVYVLLEALTAVELDMNVDRLRNEAEAKNKHADALYNYRVKRFGFDPGTGTGDEAVQ